MGALSGYLKAVGALINDRTFSFSPRDEVIGWINSARYTCALQTGCLTRLVTGQSAWGASAQPGVAIPGAMQPGALPDAGTSTEGAATGPFQTIVGVERYPYQGFFNPAAQAQHAGIKGVVDVVSLSISWGGSSKPSLDWMPWEDFQAYLRSIATLNSAYPSVWSVMDDGENGEVWVFPPPTQANDMEALCSCVPLPLYTDDDYEPIAHSFGQSIKFGAAALINMTRGRLATAQFYEQQSGLSILTSRTAVDRGKTPTWYDTGI